jgi:hypothetical protein
VMTKTERENLLAEKELDGRKLQRRGNQLMTGERLENKITDVEQSQPPGNQSCEEQTTRKENQNQAA